MFLYKKFFREKKNTDDLFKSKIIFADSLVINNMTVIPILNHTFSTTEIDKKSNFVAGMFSSNPKGLILINNGVVEYIPIDKTNDENYDLDYLLNNLIGLKEKIKEN